MNGYNFTERVRKVLALAREEAVGLDHEFVGTEHLLLSLLAEREGVAAAVFQNLDLDPDGIRAVLLRVVQPGKRPVALNAELPYTSRGKKALELAMAEARDLHHQYVGTEHLLLGLLREEKGIAAQILVDAGLTLGRTRAETLRLLGVGHTDAAPTAPAARPSPAPGAPKAPHAVAQEHMAWSRLWHALNVSQRLGAPVALTLEEDGTLTVPLGPDLVVSVAFPPGLRLRRRDAEAPPAEADASRHPGERRGP